MQEATMSHTRRTLLLRLVPFALIAAIFALGATRVGPQQPAIIEWPRIEISVPARRLWVVAETGDTLHSAPIAVGKGTTLRAEGRTWVFRTPVGATHVIKKEVAPDWVPPDWHYIEIAREKGLRLERFPASRESLLADGRRLAVRGPIIGLVDTSGRFRSIAASRDLVFDGALYIPPLGTRNRSVPGVLGAYRLQLANGIGLHGTADTASIGRAASHGCIRLREADITWLHANIPVGTRVVIR
jgi:lipoprotein-anchoring transpeptidase ErfK/SrfK